MIAHASRRQLLGASAAILLIGSTEAGEGKADELDGELLAAFAEYHRVHTEFMGPCVSDDETDLVGEMRDNALSQVVGLEPRTPEGLQAKAAVAYSALMFDVHSFSSEPWQDQAELSERIALDVLRSLLGRV